MRTFEIRACVARGGLLGALLVTGLLASGCTTVDGKIYWPG